MAKRSRVLIAVGIAALISVPRIAHPAEVKVLSDSPLEPALTQTADAFRRVVKPCALAGHVRKLLAALGIAQFERRAMVT